MKKYILLSAVSALAMPSAAFAQTSGQQQMDQQTIVVTGTRTQAVDGVQIPKTTKAKEVLTSEFIQHQTPGQSIDNIASFFAARGHKISRPKLEVEAPTGKTGLKQGSRVRHPKYGEGTVFRREGDGDDAKITVQFQEHGVKKLVEKFAQLERL